MSCRRVKKGPGRGPQSAKRQRFVELRERGWSVVAAAREVGVSRTTGANWSRGYKTYRHGQVTWFVPPLERLAVRDISVRFLSQDKRIEIAGLRLAGMSLRQIAARLGQAPSTISRELRRNASAGVGYRPFEAHRQATARRARPHRRRIETDSELRQPVLRRCGGLATRADAVYRPRRQSWSSCQNPMLTCGPLTQNTGNTGKGLPRPNREVALSSSEVCSWKEHWTRAGCPHQPATAGFCRYLALDLGLRHT